MITPRTIMILALILFVLNAVGLLTVILIG